MANPLGIFDNDLRTEGWFDETQAIAGWFDDDLIQDAGGAVVQTMTLASFGFTTQAQQNAVRNNPTTASMPRAAQSISQRLAISLSSNNLTIAAQVIALGVRNNLNAASLTFAAQSITTLMSRVIQLMVASFNLVAAAITASNAVTVARYRWKAITSTLRGVIHDDEDE